MAVVGGVYRHFKGGLYIVEDLAYHHEDKTIWVVYRSFDTKKLYVRPEKMFDSPVDADKYPEVQQNHRFELIGHVYDPDNEEEN